MRYAVSEPLALWELAGNEMDDDEERGLMLQALVRAADTNQPTWVLGEDGERAAMIVPAAAAQVIIDNDIALARGAVMVPFNRDKLISLLGWIGAHMRDQEPEFFHDALQPMQGAVITTAQELERQRVQGGQGDA